MRHAGEDQQELCGHREDQVSRVRTCHRKVSVTMTDQPSLPASGARTLALRSAPRLAVLSVVDVTTCHVTT